MFKSILFRIKTRVRIELFNFAITTNRMSLKFRSVRIQSIRELTEDASEITLELTEEMKDHFKFDAGQYLTFRAQLNGEEIRRSYSLCSSPSENGLSVGIKRVKDGLFSNYALNNWKVGDEVEVMPPSGNFKFQPDPTRKRNLVLFAAGSGITPILSIAKTLLRNEPNSQVTLFYGNKGFAHIMFAEELENLKNLYLTRFRLFHIFSQESQGIPIQKGRIDSERLSKLHQAFLKNEQIDAIYSCGPESMILNVKSYFEQQGMAASNIHFELFFSGKQTQKEQETTPLVSVTCEVDLIIDDDVVSFTMASEDRSILEAAQKAGADVPYACKGGVCCTCKAKILEGKASMKVNYALEPDEVENGFVLTCQAIPTTTKITVSFDE